MIGNCWRPPTSSSKRINKFWWNWNSVRVIMTSAFEAPILIDYWSRQSVWRINYRRISNRCIISWCCIGLRGEASPVKYDVRVGHTSPPAIAISSVNVSEITSCSSSSVTLSKRSSSSLPLSDVNDDIDIPTAQQFHFISYDWQLNDSHLLVGPQHRVMCWPDCLMRSHRTDSYLLHWTVWQYLVR